MKEVKILNSIKSVISTNVFSGNMNTEQEQERQQDSYRLYELTAYCAISLYDNNTNNYVSTVSCHRITQECM